MDGSSKSTETAVNANGQKQLPVARFMLKYPLGNP